MHPNLRRRLQDDDESGLLIPTSMTDSICATNNELTKKEKLCSMLRSWNPHKHQLQAMPRLESTQTYIWKDCDRGIAAQRRLTGTHVFWSAAQRVIFLIMQLIPITEFAPELYEWGPNKTRNTPMVKMGTTYAYPRPSIITILTDATRSTLRCRNTSADR